MANRWPNCAYTFEDVMAFCQMLTAQSSTASVIDGLEEDLQKLWTRAYNNDELESFRTCECDSHLVQIEKLDDILDPLPGLLEKVFDMKKRKEAEVNSQNPEKAIEIRSKGNANVHYHSTVINGGYCTCPITFGGEVYKEAREQSVRGANSTVEGVALQTWIRDNLLTVDSWYSRELSVLTLTIECLGGDLVLHWLLRSALSEISQRVFVCFVWVPV